MEKWQFGRRRRYSRKVSQYTVISDHHLVRLTSIKFLFFLSFFSMNARINGGGQDDVCGIRLGIKAGYLKTAWVCVALRLLVWLFSLTIAVSRFPIKANLRHSLAIGNNSFYYKS